MPILYPRESDNSDELLSLIDEERETIVVVRGTDTQSETAGPLITFPMTREHHADVFPLPYYR